MPKESFSFRLVFDYDFYEMLKEHTKNHRELKPPLLTKLMYINAQSKEYPRRHNIMSGKIFDRILQDNPSMSRELLRASFCPVEEPEIEKIDDEIERTIKYAIDVASLKPFKSIILTSLNKEKEYLKNEHYKDVKEVIVKAGEEAIRLIDSFWEATCY